MKRVILCGAAVAALAFSATPALAQVVVGGVAGDINVNTVHVTDNSGLNVSIDNTLTASSGSGFGANFTVNPNLAGGVNAATFSGSGTALSVAGDLSLNLGGGINGGNWGLGGDLNTDVAGSYSESNGAFTAQTTGVAEISGQVMNFGQSEYTKSFTLDYSDARDLTMDNWNAGGFIVGGFAGF